MLEESRKMFTFGYDSYMKYAFPKDELDPIHCTGMIFNDTVWKFNNFLADEILREINFIGPAALYGKFSIFPSLRFYVKSIL